MPHTKTLFSNDMKMTSPRITQFMESKSLKHHKKHVTSVHARDLKRHVWRLTLAKNKLCNQCEFALFGQVIWQRTWRFTLEKNPTNVTNVILHLSTVSRQSICEPFKNSLWWKSKQMQPMYLCICASLHLWFENALENSLWRQIIQMQQMYLCVCPCRQFREAFENSLWWKIRQM